MEAIPPLTTLMNLNMHTAGNYGNVFHYIGCSIWEIRAEGKKKQQLLFSLGAGWVAGEVDKVISDCSSGGVVNGAKQGDTLTHSLEGKAPEVNQPLTKNATVEPPEAFLASLVETWQFFVIFSLA